MIAFPHAKINLGLHVTGKRPDGYHDIETCFYPIGWRDVLEAVEADETRLDIFGLDVPGTADDNLILRAYHMLKERFDIPPLHFALLKNIPMGAGLGGGSADAAFALRMLNDNLQLGVGTDELRDLAATLGSDCAFFIDPRPMLGTGRGDVLEPVGISLSGLHLVVLYPGMAVSTPWAYGQVAPGQPAMPLAEVLQRPIDEWDGLLVNDFEGPVFAAHPMLELVKLKLYEMGAIYASMSGSGSAIFGLFVEAQDRPAVAQAFRLEPWQVWVEKCR